MDLIKFLLNNYINILLIFGLVLAIFISKSYKNINNIFLLMVSGISMIFLIFNYCLNSVYNDGNYITYKNIFLILFLIQPLQIYFLILSLIPYKKRNSLLLIIPLIINTLIMVFYSNTNYIFEVLNDKTIIKGQLFYFEIIVCLIYMLIIFIISIYYLIKKETFKGLIILFSSVACSISLILGAYSLSFNIGISVVLFSGLLIFIYNYTQYQTQYSALQEKMIQEQRTSLAISQIQPHFLYNSLATIGFLCKKDPLTASKAIDQFSDYLRTNLNSLTKKDNIPFLEELDHIKTYVWLEQLRFEERLKVIYDINYTSFFVPALSIQPLVENAIKHGICNKVEGGTLYIRTIEYLDYIKVIVEDDGVGFDPKVKKNDNRTHVGINNVRSRLSSMSDATLDIKSVIGKGTTITITFFKEK